MNYEAKSRRKLPRDETLKITTNTRRPRTTRPSAERRASKARFAQYFTVPMENLFKICLMDRPDLLGTRAREHSIPTSLKESPNLRTTWIRCETFPVYSSYIKPRRCSQHDGQDSQIACGEFGLKPRLAKYQSFSPQFSALQTLKRRARSIKDGGNAALPHVLERRRVVSARDDDSPSTLHLISVRTRSQAGSSWLSVSW